MNKSLIGGIIIGFFLVTQAALAGPDRITMQGSLVYEGKTYQFPHDGYVCVYDDDRQLIPFIRINRSGFIKLLSNSGVQALHGVACLPGDHMDKPVGGIRCDKLAPTKISASNSLHFSDCKPMKKPCPERCEAVVVDQQIEEYMEKQRKVY